MHLYLIRHGQSYVNLKDWKEGNKDVGLTNLGIQQAAALAAWMAKNIPTVYILYASTMSRARETAEMLGNIYNLNIFFNVRKVRTRPSEVMNSRPSLPVKSRSASTPSAAGTFLRPAN